ncbi:MAG: hypothetical protein IKX52_02670, partial [Clostridia bacterium]|nr:hypothetical protein [Clostridia bacterium]
MEGLQGFINNGAELGLNEILILVFVALVILALLIGYLLGRTLTNKEKKQAKKAEKKQAKNKKADEKLAAAAARDAEKEAKKEKTRRPSLEKEEPIVWVEPDDDRSGPIIPSRNTESNIFIPAKSENSPHAVPVVAKKGRSEKPSEQKVKISERKAPPVAPAVPEKEE